MVRDAFRMQQRRHVRVVGGACATETQTPFNSCNLQLTIQ